MSDAEDGREWGRPAVMTAEREALIRKYASGDVSWHLLQRTVPDGYLTVLGNLAELGLRPPTAPPEGQERGRAILRAVLAGPNR